MKILTDPGEMSASSRADYLDGKTIGFVPTMGFLHDGHLSLLDHARTRGADRLVMSIFVNPLQFGPNEDFESYPHDFERDRERALEHGVDTLFCPDRKALYPSGFTTYVEAGKLGDVLCGASRPGHFRGVCTVVSKLFNIVAPHLAVFGQKDAQQFLIIRRMVRDLNMNIDVLGAPIVRESDGLAMSSRNVYLNPAEREQAVALSRAMEVVKADIADGTSDAGDLTRKVVQYLKAFSLVRLDYFSIVDIESLQPAKEVGPGTLVAIAAFVGTTRLIDNFIIEGE